MNRETYANRGSGIVAALAERSTWLCSSLLIALIAACSSTPATGAGGSGGGSSALSSSAGAVAVNSAGSGGALPVTFTVSGVVTDGSKPVEGATVMQGGGQPTIVTGPDGAYAIELTQTIPGIPTVVAAKLGYRAAGVEFLSLPDGPVELVLLNVTLPDNPNYTFGDPGKGDPTTDTSTEYCGHCHTTLVKQFQTSAHARATRDPLVQDLYAGVSEAFTTQAACTSAGGSWRAGLVPGTSTDTISKCYVGGGVLPDLNPACGGPGTPACDDPALPVGQKPTAFGHCADCHAPGIDGPAGGRSLHEAVGIAFENGNHCDVCHHARDVDLTKPPGVAGALVLQRPRDKLSDQPGAKLRQVMFGPLIDVPNAFMGGSYQPKFGTSDLCGACHEQKQEALVPGATLNAARWPSGLPTHSTYSEWAASPYNSAGTPCQFCHMPADDTGLTNSLDATTPGSASITFGFVRTPEQTKKHIFRSPLEGNPRLIDQAVGLALGTNSTATDLTVQVQVKNNGAGHAIPTGEPMRALLLLVDAQACGQPMVPSGGMTLSDVAGATAEGRVGVDVTIAASTVTWAAGAAKAKPGDRVRVVRPTGTYDDYLGIGFFANPMLTAAEKGLEIRTPVGEASVLSVNAGTLTLSASLPVQAGDLVYVGDTLASPVLDGDGSRALAGRAGYTFARVLLDPVGQRSVPHYRAVDIASDNRIAPTASATTTHAFAIPAGCSSASVSATLIYRPLPVALARQRGWDARDYVVASTAQTVALP